MNFDKHLGRLGWAHWRFLDLQAVETFRLKKYYENLSNVETNLRHTLTRRYSLVVVGIGMVVSVFVYTVGAVYETGRMTQLRRLICEI